MVSDDFSGIITECFGSGVTPCVRGKENEIRQRSETGHVGSVQLRRDRAHSTDMNAAFSQPPFLRSIRSFFAVGFWLAPATMMNADIIPYEACGERVETGGVVNCIVHVADDGTIVRPIDLAGVQIGDRVFVSGTINTNTASVCNGTIVPTLINDTIERCVAECGQLVEVGGCLRFDSDRGVSFILENTGTFAAGARVYVHANGTDGTVRCHGEDLPFIRSNLIADCFERTGRIVSQFGCPSLLTADGSRFDLLTFGPFAEGDFVSVQGALDEEINGGCSQPLVNFNSIKEAFGDAGTLVNDPTCGPIFVADTIGIKFVLDNTGAFQVGDRVVVTGQIDNECSGPSGCATPCLRGNSIGALTTACGSIDFGPAECLVFTPDDGSASFALEFANFSIPGPLFVAGTLEAPGTLCDDGAGTSVMRHNVFLPCVDVCGEFRTGFHCTPLFSADDGETYWADNRGPYNVDDRVRIRGGLHPGCNSSFCPFTCLRVHTIGPCQLIVGDINGDGSIDTDDTMPFIEVLLELDDDPFRVQASDMNIDGVLNGRDIGEFVLVVLGVG